MSNRRDRWNRRRIGFEKPKRFVVIAMEGAETEPRYFEEFKPSREAETQIKLVSNPNHKSKPKEVFNRLAVAFRPYSIKRGDEAWMVIDRDAWTDEELHEVYGAAQAAGFQIAMSNPCFELWLYLHLRDAKPFMDRHHCQRELAAILHEYTPERKGDYDAASLVKAVRAAAARAKLGDSSPYDVWPKQQATRVYRLVERLFQLDKK
jgi:hypothetical protein